MAPHTDELTPGQQRTQAANAAIAARFPTEHERSDYYRDLAKRSHAGRLHLAAIDAAALLAAFATFERILGPLLDAREGGVANGD